MDAIFFLAVFGTSPLEQWLVPQTLNLVTGVSALAPQANLRGANFLLVLKFEKVMQQGLSITRQQKEVLRSIALQCSQP